MSYHQYESFVIRTFKPTDQDGAKTLILAGLVEHWGWLDPALNPDLDDIGASYAAGDFLVAVAGRELVATGALSPAGDGVGRIERMSVAKSQRRLGIGRALLQALIEIGRDREYRHIVLETTSTWTGVRTFYENNGFTLTHEAAGDTHYVLVLD